MGHYGAGKTIARFSKCNRLFGAKLAQLPGMSLPGSEPYRSSQCSAMSSVSSMAERKLPASNTFRPIAAQQFRLLQNGLRGLLLLVRGITVFAEDAADENADLGLG